MRHPAFLTIPNNASTTDRFFGPVERTSLGSATEGQRAMVAPGAFDVTNLRLWVSNNIGAGESVQYVLNIDTGSGFSAGNVEVTVAGASETEDESTGTDSINKGDLIEFERIFSASPTSRRTATSYVLTMSADNESAHMGCLRSALSNSQATFIAAPWGLTDSSETDDHYKCQIPISVDGAVQNFIADISANPASGCTVKVALSKSTDNGQNASEISSVSFTNSSATQLEDTGGATGINAGDTFSVVITVTGANPGSGLRLRWGFVYESDTDGYAPCGVSRAIYADDEYYPLMGEAFGGGLGDSAFNDARCIIPQDGGSAWIIRDLRSAYVFGNSPTTANWTLVDSSGAVGTPGDLETSESASGFYVAASDLTDTHTPSEQDFLAFQYTSPGSPSTNVWIGHGYIIEDQDVGGGGGSSIKTFNGLAYASAKTVDGLAIASVKTYNGLA